MMQPVQSIFLALLLAHLLGDFILQPKWMLERRDKRLWVLLCHGLIHYVLAWTLISIFAPAAFLSVANHAVVAAYSAVHLLIDKLKCRLIARRLVPDNWQIFLLDQFLHVLVVAAAACALARSFAALFAGFSLSPLARIHILQAAIVYVAVIFGGGYLIRYLTRDLAARSVEKHPAQLNNAGLYVGWIERFLIITAMALQSPALVGLILTGKSIARFPEFKQAQFAEYFLIGTLLSISLSLVGGILLLYLLHGAVSLQ